MGEIKDDRFAIGEHARLFDRTARLISSVFACVNPVAAFGRARTGSSPNSRGGALDRDQTES